MTEQVTPFLNLAHLLPELLLFGFALIVMAIAIIHPAINSKIIGYVIMLLFAIAAVFVFNKPYGTVYGDLFINEYSAQFFKFVFLFIGFSAAAVKSNETVQNPRNALFEFALLILSIVAMMFLSMTGNMVSLFASLELCTLPILLMVAIQNGNDNKLGGKYLLILLLSALLILFGLGFLFGLSGNVNLLQMKLQIAIVHLTRREIGVIILLSVAAILSGLILKSSIPPFHKWSRELHHYMPYSMVLLISVAVPVAVLAAFSKIFINGLFAFYGPEMSPNDWGRVAAFIAFTSILFGTIQMVRQKGLVSLLYFANMVQLGFIFTGLVSMNQYGLQAAAFYIVAYVLAFTGIYAFAQSMRVRSNDLELAALGGLYRISKPGAVFLGLLLMSVAGLPITAGFAAKFSVIEAAYAMATVDRTYHWMFILTAAAAICAAVGFIKFTKISYSLFKKTDTNTEQKTLKIPVSILSVLIITSIATLVVGFLPDPVLDYLSRISAAFGFIVE